MDYPDYDDRPYEERRFSPAGPAVIWGALMTVALIAAGATAMTAPNVARERMIAAGDGQDLQKSVRQLAAQRDELADRLARLERGVGELKVAAAASAGTSAASEVTGSIDRPETADAQVRPASFGLALGPDASVDAVKRRWSTLTARYPQQLGKLTPRTIRRNGVYELVAGPFALRAEADRACGALADQGFACDTTPFVGDPLPRS